MNLIRALTGVGIATALVSIPTLAFAQQPTDPNANPNGGATTTTTTTTTQPAQNNPNATGGFTGQGGASATVQPTPNGGTVTTYHPSQSAATGGALPPPRSYDEPAPPVAAPAVPDVGVTKEAGVGGTQAYGRAGVLELGGSMGFAKANNFTQANVSPSIGWFFMDNVEISGIVAFNYINASDKNGQSTSSTYTTVLAEPSFHIPFSNDVFGFLGVGAGLGYSKDAGAGLAIAPRLGMNVLVGRSGILTPALQLVYSTTNAVQTPEGTLLAVSTSFGANVGYTVMW